MQIRRPLLVTRLNLEFYLRNPLPLSETHTTSIFVVEFFFSSDRIDLGEIRKADVWVYVLPAIKPIENIIGDIIFVQTQMALSGCSLCHNLSGNIVECREFIVCIIASFGSVIGRICQGFNKQERSKKV